ncbi:MAG: hypothetical protein Q9181_005156 [Wetmoreana brouardii]
MEPYMILTGNRILKMWVPDYEAFSYTWGNVTSKVCIMLNRSLVEITHNLFVALKALRLPAEDRVLWVDALCINRNDIPERSKQVQRIRTFYQRARRTVVWLGELNEQSDHAIDLLEKLGGTQQQINSFPWPKPFFGGKPTFDPAYGIADDERTLYDEFYTYLRGLSLMEFRDLGETEWAALEAFFTHRQSWTRMWIIQEVASSQMVQIQCGSRSLAFDTLKYLPHLRAYKGKQLDYANKDEVAHDRFNALISKPYQIYALYGLSSVDKNMLLPTPDYSKTVSEIHCETIRAIIQHTADLNVLCLPKSFQGAVTHQMPSWVPDWTTEPKVMALMEESYKATGDSLPQGPEFDFATEVPDAKGNVPSGLRALKYQRGKMRLVGAKAPEFTDGLIRRPECHSQAPQDPKMLRLNGFFLDSISKCGQEIPDKEFENGSRAWKKCLVEWEKLLKAFRVFARHGHRVCEVDPGYRHPKLDEFVYTLCRGILYAHDGLPGLGDTEDLVKAYTEHYLVWTCRISAGEASVQISEPVVELIFENWLRKRVRGWKFAMTAQGQLALVPECAGEKDALIMLFGADVPLVLRPICRIKNEIRDEVCWIQVGTAYVHGMMSGEALEIAKEKGLKTETFCLM